MTDPIIITTFLFSKCNLKCDHCFYTTNRNDVDVAKIRQVPQLIAQAVSQQAIIQPTNRVDVVLCGGELLIDGFDRSIFDLYRNLIDQTRQLLQSFDVRFELISNGVFEKRDRVVELLEATNSKISISYDPVGRYSTDRQHQTAIANIEYFNDLGLLSSIETVASSKAIDYWFHHPNQLIDLNKYRVHVAWYIPNHHIQSKLQLKPTEDQIASWVNLIISLRLYNFTEITQIVESLVDDNPTTYCQGCFCRSIDLPSGLACTHNCSLLMRSTDDIDQQTVNQSIRVVSSEQVAQYNRFKIGSDKCKQCKYNRICPKKCWLADDGSLAELAIDRCFIYQTYQFLTNNRQIVNEYSKYLEKQ